MDLNSEYFDYDVYLEPDFSPIKFANSLVIATSSPADIDIDLDIPEKRLEYDLQEVEKLIESISKEHYAELIQKANQVQDAKTALEPVKAGLDSINNSYAKLNRDVIAPYERSQKMHTALRRLHLTSSLLRTFTWYLYLARQVNALIDSDQPEGIYQAISTIKELQHLMEKSPGLESIHVVREHSSVIEGQIDKIRSQCFQRIRNFSISTDKNICLYACRALYIVNPQDLSRSIASFLKSAVTSTTLLLNRALGASILQFEGAANDARSRARSIHSLDSILSLCEISDSTRHDSLALFIRDSLDIQSLTSSFWRDVASSIDSKLRDLMTRNPVSAKQLQGNSTKMMEIMRTSVINGGGVSSNGPEVKVMMNCFSILTR